MNPQVATLCKERVELRKRPMDSDFGSELVVAVESWLKTSPKPQGLFQNSDGIQHGEQSKVVEGVVRSATVVQLLDYYPYGTKRLSEGTDVSQREYIGEFFDENTSLNYLNARYYSSANGKFISQDPATRDVPEKFLSDPQQLNYYSYARNNPIILSDPSGQCVDGISTAACIFAWAALTAILGGTAIETYGAVKGDPKVIELGQGARATGETGGAGLIQSVGQANPITGQKGTKPEVKNNRSSVKVKNGSTPESILNVSGSRDTVRVGRWMSQAEYEAMVKSGQVQQGGGGVTYVSTSGPDSFGKQAAPGTIYVEFDVPQNSLTPASKPDQPMIVGPNASKSATHSAQSSGSSVEFPQASNIQVKGVKKQ